MMMLKDNTCHEEHITMIYKFISRFQYKVLETANKITQIRRSVKKVISHLQKISVFSPNAGKYRPEKLPILKIFMQ